jgi:pyridoxamine 5'-phosphate oxidase
MIGPVNDLDPIAQFHELFARAKQSEPGDATAFALATAGPTGAPTVRKAGELAANPRAALCFYWPTLGAQVRVEGAVSPVGAEESDAYFATRPRESQIGAWASRQSARLGSRAELVESVAGLIERFAGQPVPRPPFWGGYRVAPERIEFWTAGEFRLHDRLVYTRDEGGWKRERLYP